MITRRPLIFAAASWVAGPSMAAPPPPVVTLLGDSITAGLGLPSDEALPARLQEALQALGVPARVRGAGVSGDTSGGGLARVDFSVLPDTRVCVVELGANDFLQSVDPKVLKANLLAIIRRLKARRIAVVLAASRAPGAASGAYGREFNAVFASLARSQRVILAGDLLEGVLDRPGFRQADGLHPNAAGAAIMARRLAPFVARALKAR